MKKALKTLNLLAVSAITVGGLATSSLAGSFIPESQGTLGSAHSALLKGDFPGMAESIRSVFEDKRSGRTERENALKLLETAYGIRKGQTIPVNWSLPAEIPKMKISVSRVRKPERDVFALKVAGELKAKGSLKQLQLVKYPSEIILDKAANLGEFEESTEPDGTFEFELASPKTSVPAEEGLYLLNFTLSNGKETKGWFVLSGLNSSDSPEVSMPSVGQTFSTASPTLRWSDFRSPEYKSYERRGLWLGIAKVEAPAYLWNQVWSRYESDPTTTETTVGRDSTAYGVRELPSGNYQLVVAYSESRKFGDLILQRRSVTQVPFQVKAR